MEGWSRIAQAGNGITEVLSTDPAYPCGDTPNDCTTDSRVYRIGIGVDLHFGFAAPTDVAVGLVDINDHANTSSEDTDTITPWNTALPITDNNIAWIDAHTSAQNAAPRMPQLKFQIRGRKSGVTLTKQVFRLVRDRCWGSDMDLITGPSNSASCIPRFGFAKMPGIKEVISDQIAGNECNKLPTAFYYGEPNNPLLMATRNGNSQPIWPSGSPFLKHRMRRRKRRRRQLIYTLVYDAPE